MEGEGTINHSIFINSLTYGEKDREREEAAARNSNARSRNRKKRIKKLRNTKKKKKVRVMDDISLAASLPRKVKACTHTRRQTPAAAAAAAHNIIDTHTGR